MKTFCFGIVCAAMLALSLAFAGCGESGDKARQQTKAEMKSAADTRPAEAAKVVTDEQPARSEEDQAKEAVATTERPPAEAVEIPLGKIWAHNMPGTRDVRELEPDKFGKAFNGLSGEEKSRLLRESLFNQIGGVLGHLSPNETAESGFAVFGTGLEALGNVQAVLVKQEPRRQSFPAGGEISIFFFSHSFNQYVHLDSVERKKNVVEIRYRFVPHMTKEMTAHLALIPLGKLPVGKYQVDIVRLPMEQKYVEKGYKVVDVQWEPRVVCRPFSFVVVGDH